MESVKARLGLVNASLLSMILLSIGGVLIGIAFFVAFAQGKYPLLSLLLIVIAIADSIVLKKFRKLYTLSKEYENSNGEKSVEQEITDFAAKNPKWIMLVTQTYSAISIIILISKFS